MTMRALLIALLLASSAFAHENTYDALITRVVDGDTVDAIVYLGFDVQFKTRFRLGRIDAPEMKTENGKILQKELQSLLLGKRVLIECKKRDKWRRWLAEIIFDGLNINDWLLKTGKVEPYPKKKS